MGLTQDRLGQEYGNGQSGNVEAVGLGKLGRRHKKSKRKRLTVRIGCLKKQPRVRHTS